MVGTCGEAFRALPCRDLPRHPERSRLGRSYNEICRIEALLRSSLWKTALPNHQLRPVAVSKAVEPIKISKLRRRLGRATEFLKKCERKRFDEANQAKVGRSWSGNRRDGLQEKFAAKVSEIKVI